MEKKLHYDRAQSEKPSERSWTSTTNLTVTTEKEARKTNWQFDLFKSLKWTFFIQNNNSFLKKKCH